MTEHTSTIVTAKKLSLFEKIFTTVETNAEDMKINHKYIFKIVRSLTEQKLKKSTSKNFLSAQSDTSQYRPQDPKSQFLKSVLEFLDVNDEKRKENMKSLTEKIKVKPTKPIETILNLCVESNHIVSEIIQLKWYPYISKRLKNQKNSNTFINSFKNEIEFMRGYIGDIIYYIYEPWLGDTESEKLRTYNKIFNQIVPKLLTVSSQWNYIYPMLLEKLGKKKISIKVNATQDTFQIQPKFNCSKLPIAFEQTINKLRQIHESFDAVVKVERLKQLPKILRQEIHEHQKILIQKNELREYQMIDSDNIVSCFEYCLFKLGQPSFLESLIYLECFYQQQTLSEFQIAYLMAGLKSAAETLRMRDERGAIRHSRRSISFKSSIINPSQLLQLGILTFSKNCKFAHCFDFFTDRRMRSLQPTWVSLLSDIPLPKVIEIKVRIHQLTSNNLILGLAQNDVLKLRQKEYLNSPQSVAYNLKNGQIFSQHKAGVKPFVADYPIEVMTLRIKVKQTIQYVFSQSNIVVLPIQHLGPEVYLHLVLSYQTQVEIFCN